MYFCLSSSMLRLKSRVPGQSSKTHERLSSAVQIIVLLTTLCLLYTPGEGTQSSSHHHRIPHRCFVCLPQDKASMLSKEIVDSFPGKPVPDCASFPNTTQEQINAQEFQFNCPKSYSEGGGCLLRMSGSEISRTCSPYKLNDCKVVNSIELCYCSDSLCNSDKVTMKARPVGIPQETPRISRHFHEGETDDEDLLRTGDQHHTNYHDDEHEETGSGHEPPEERQEPDNLSPLNTNISSFIPSQSEEEESEEAEDRNTMDGDDTFQNQSHESNETTRTSQHIPEAIGTANSYLSPQSLVPLSTLCLLVIWRNF